MKIKQISAREILDSRGYPTIEADLVVDNGIIASASIPSGASTGTYEACELRDGDPHRYAGRGVLQAVSSVNGEINDALRNKEYISQKALDEQLCLLDGTENKSRLGANAILAVSLAYAKAQAMAAKKPLFVSLHDDTTDKMMMPVPMMNILNGGAHADNNVDIQEFMIMPIGAENFKDALRMGAEIFYQLKAVLKQAGLQTAVGDEGGFAPDLKSNRQAFDMISEAVHKAGYRLGEDIVFALDIAASELFSDGRYHLSSENQSLTSEQMVAYYQTLAKDYPIFSIEDGLDEKDWRGWQYMTNCLGNSMQLVGDDLFVTNPLLLQRGIDQQVANAILIKLNQIGTLSETLAAIHLAKNNNYRCVISHRSGETEETFIADLAVATGAGQIKTGSLCRTDRIAKYNQLLRINDLCSLDYAGKYLR